jgi:Na+-transporting NADH:ubiquinone oxidoreductase subunit A
MKLRGGYNVHVAGTPPDSVETLSDPEVLHIPLQSRRFKFTQVLVANDRRVRTGQPLAKDPSNFALPLIAPRSGTVKLDTPGHVTLVDLEKDGDPPHPPGDPAKLSEGMQRYILSAVGAWRFACDARTGALPDPFGKPAAVIVSAARFEPYEASASAQLKDKLPQFTRGIEIINGLLKPEKLFVAIPRGRGAFISELDQALRGLSFVEVVRVPAKYPHGDVRLLSRALGLNRRSDDDVWGLPVAGVLAIEDALRTSRPSTSTIVSIAGPEAETPRHVEALVGYPLKELVGGAMDADTRIVNGGALSGAAMPADQLGLDVECEGLTILHEHTNPEMFAFAHPGFSKRSIARAFFSALRPAFLEKYTTALRGEVRACVSCGFCEEVCPAGIMPNLIHRFLYQDAIEEAEKARLDLCMECGLCTFVCPSKIELRKQFIDAKEAIRNELETEEAPA